MAPKSSENLADFINRYQQQTEQLVWKNAVSYAAYAGIKDEKELPLVIKHPSPPYMRTPFGTWLVLVIPSEVFYALSAREGSSVVVAGRHRDFDRPGIQENLEQDVKTWHPQCRGKHPRMVAWFSRTMVFIVESDTPTNNNPRSASSHMLSRVDHINRLSKQNNYVTALEQLYQRLGDIPLRCPWSVLIDSKETVLTDQLLTQDFANLVKEHMVRARLDFADMLAKSADELNNTQKS